MATSNCTRCGGTKPNGITAWCNNCLHKRSGVASSVTKQCIPSGLGANECTICKKSKVADEFRWNPRFGLRTECLECEQVWLRCANCKEVKKHKEFPIYKASSTGRHGWCNSCHAARVNNKYHNDPEFLAKRKEYNKLPHVLEKARNYGNSPKGRENTRKFRQTPQGKFLRTKAEHKRRLKMEQAVCTFTYKQWQELLTEYPCCYWCNRPFSKRLKPTQDHIVPVSKGGSHTKENIRPSCSSCNSSKGNRTKPKTSYGSPT